MKKVILGAVMALSVAGVAAQTCVKPYVYAEGMPQGLVYALPQTALEVTVVAEMRERKPGVFYQYAERFLALTDVVTEESVEWSVKRVRVDAVAVADGSRRFEVMADRRGAADRVVMDERGVICGVNVEVPEVAEVPQRKGAEKRVREALEFDMSVLNEEALTATSMPKMAELAAKQIYRIRESRAAILAGEIEGFPDGRALKEILKRWDEDERELIALFAGKSVTRVEKRRYEIVPKGDMRGYTVARLSRVEGIVDADDVIGTPIYVDVVGVYPPVPVESGKKRGKESEGFAYVVPGSAEVTVRNGGRRLVTERVVMPQFGYVARLDTRITDREGACVWFDAESGAIVRVGTR